MASGLVPELEMESIRLASHLATEFLTAILLVVGGVLLLASRFAPPLALLALGMLLYTVIVSLGYFGQLGQWPMVALSLILLVLALVSVVIILRTRRGSGSR